MIRKAGLILWAACLPLLGSATPPPTPRELHDQPSRANPRERAAASRPLRARHRGDSDLSNHARGRTWNAGAMRDWAKGEGALVAAASRSRPTGPAAAAARTNHGAHATRRRRLPILYWTGDYTAPIPRRPRFRCAIRSTPTGASAGKTSYCPAYRSDERAALVSERADRLAAPERRGDVRRLRRAHRARARQRRRDGACGATSIVRASSLSDLVARDARRRCGCC